MIPARQELKGQFGSISDGKKIQRGLPVSLALYQALVNRCARDRLDYPIANGSPRHARILISKLFEIATDEVVVVSGSLRGRSEDGVEIYAHSPVIQNAQNFLENPNAELSILIQEGALDCGDENDFLKEIVNAPTRKGKVRLSVPKVGALDTSVPHFMVADGSSYRLETGEDAADKGGDAIKAIANFGDRDTGSDLRKYFSELVDSLDDLDACSVERSFAAGALL